MSDDDLRDPAPQYTPLADMGEEGLHHPPLRLPSSSHWLPVELPLSIHGDDLHNSTISTKISGGRSKSTGKAVIRNDSSSFGGGYFGPQRSHRRFFFDIPLSVKSETLNDLRAGAARSEALATAVGLLDDPDPDMLTQVVEVLGSICRRNDTRATLVKLNMLPKLVALLKNNDSLVVWQTTNVLEGLCRHDDTKATLVRLGMLRKLVALLRNHDSLVVWQAIKFLEGLCRDYDIRATLFKLDTLPKLVALLQKNSSIVVWQAIKSLEALCAHKDFRAAFVSLNVPSNLITLLQHHDNDLVMQVTNALETFCARNDIRTAFIRIDVLSSLATLLQHLDSDVALQATNTLKALCVHDDIRVALVAFGTLQWLVTLLSNPDPNIVSRAIILLHELHIYDSIQAALLSFGVLPNLVTLLEYYDWHEHITIKMIDETMDSIGNHNEQHTNMTYFSIAQLLFNLAIGGESSFQVQIINSIINLLESHSYNVQKIGIQLISKLRQDEKTHHTLLNGITKLVDLIKIKDIHVQTAIVAAISMLLDKEQIHLIFLNANVTSVIAHLLENASFDIVKKLLPSLYIIVQYVDLQPALLNTNIIHSLAILQNHKLLMDDINKILIHLVHNEHLSAAFDSPLLSQDMQADFGTWLKSTPISSQCLVGAQGALDVVLAKAADIEEIMTQHDISLHNYDIQVGFNEDLIICGAGHLEEIYVYLFENTRHVPNLMEALQKLMAPFPCIFMTTGESYYPELSLENSFTLDTIVLQQADRRGLYPTLKLTDHGVYQAAAERDEGEQDTAPNRDGDKGNEDQEEPPKENQELGEGGSGNGGPSETGSGNSGYTNGGRGNSGLPNRDGGDNGGQNQGDRNDGSPDGEGGASDKTAVTSVITPPFLRSFAYLYSPSSMKSSTNINQSSSHKKALTYSSNYKDGSHFQSLKTQAIINVMDRNQFDRTVEFEALEFNTEALTTEDRYHLLAARVEVDADVPGWPKNYHPHPTPATETRVKDIDTRQTDHDFTVSLSTKNGLSAGYRHNRGSSGSRETIQNLSKIKFVSGDTYVKWTYCVDDESQQDNGLYVPQGNLPIVCFNYPTGAKTDKPFRIELCSYWRTRDIPGTSRWKLLNGGKRQRPSFLLHNLCHLTRITLPPKFSTNQRMEFRLNVRMPYSPGREKEREPSGSGGIKLYGNTKEFEDKDIE